ncbi:MAG: undecaprenyl/decaprenyl-phosphate alpha-N-acetylglucosaminyl 1-phosphate transferase, partial [Candidatus Zixiibacteriota bacterium]
MRHFVPFLCALGVVLIITPISIRVARKLGFLDYPSALKIHANPTPLLGGLAVFAAFLVALLAGLALYDLPVSADMVSIMAAG